MLKKLFTTLLVLILCLFTTVLYVSAEDDTVIVGEAKYRQEEVLSTLDLGYGIIEKNIKGYASSNLEGFNAAGSGGGGLNVAGQEYPQNVNILEVPTSNEVRIVNWVYQNNYGWGRGTVEACIKNFELLNPGWKVLAAVNGDFFDISGDNPLPDTTTGSTVSNGNVLKNYGYDVVGFTNNGTNNSFIGGKTLNFTENYYIVVYDNNDNIIKEYLVDQLNPEISDDLSGINVFCVYPYWSEEEENVRAYPDIFVPTNGFICQSPVSCIPFHNNYSAYSFYGKGALNKIEESKKLNYNQFGIYSTNEELNNYLNSGNQVRIQKNVIGDYASCDNIVGCGVKLVDDNQGVVHNDKNRHPRTMVGVKEDGTILMVTVDGRQPLKNMYGMTYDEQAALMEYYGCSMAYNLDGGGSTTIIVRQGDELKVLNSPSDGSARRDANALLVVVPEISLKVSNVTDTSLTLSKPDNYKGMTIDNIKVYLNNQKYNLKDSLTIDNLTPSMLYTYYYTYDRTYNGIKTNIQSPDCNVQMGKKLPVINELHYTIDNNKFTFSYDISDEASAITSAVLYYSSGYKTLDLSSNSLVIENIGKFDNADLELVLFVEIGSSTTDTIVLRYSDISQVVPDGQAKEGCGKSSMVFISSMIGLIGLSYIILKKKK